MSGCRASVICVLLVLTASCARSAPGTSASACEPDEERGLVAVEFEDHCVSAEVAATGAERQLGLMNRTELAEDAGMLFIFPGSRHGGFWMKNTLIPLSIAYMSRDGERLTIRRIMDMQPCESDPCPSYDPEIAYEAALEVNRGWFADAGLSKGSEARVRGTLPTPE